MGANDGQAEQPGLTRQATALPDGRFATDGDSSAVVAARDIRLRAAWRLAMRPMVTTERAI
jgi:hypothetical protein